MSANDFDFLVGRWTVKHHRLAKRLAGCTEWAEFDGTATLQPILGGLGNIDDNVLELPEGTYRAVSLRTWDPASDRWAIWWLDARHPHRLDPPVVGRFAGGVGVFEGDDVFEGRPIRVRFRWRDTATAAPRWEQAFSEDGGRSWETNWTMVFTRAADNL
jgi:hypothetical protein